MSSEKDVESKKAYYYYTIKPLDAIEKVDLSLLPYTVEKSEHGLTVIINMADDYENLKQEIERDIKNFFFAYGVLSDLQSVSVKSGGHYKELPDGRGEHGIAIQDITANINISEVKISQMTKEGKIIDPSIEMRRKNERLFYLVNEHFHNDITAKRIINIYREANDNPNSAFTILYKIRDQLCDEFSESDIGRNCQEKLEKILGITENDFSYFGEVTNDPSIRQSRHAGKKDVELRDATTDEMREIRRIAKDMIFAYLEYLDAK